MEAFDQAIGRGLDLYQRLCEEDEALAQEFRASRTGFEISGLPGERALAERRHLEWFVLQRYSDAIANVPVVGKREEWESLADSAVRDHGEALLDSRASAFTITSIDAGGTVWTRDLFGGGEFPLVEKGSATTHQVDDLLVGRIFPVGDGGFRLSPAASSFRNRGLVAALRSDVESLRKSRRGSLRIQQSELERLFFASETVARGEAESEKTQPAPRRTRNQALGKAKAELLAAGLDADLTVEVLATLAEAVAKGAPASIVTEALNLLAFDTEADLEVLRTSLAELWQDLQDPAPEGENETPKSVVQAGDVAQDAVSAALAKFDEGRASGADLEDLFESLEKDLGIDPEVVRDDEIAPDFPGVVGVVLEEYRWDLRREGQDRVAEEASALQALAEYGADIGVFEELGARELIDFAGRWVFENTKEPLAVVRALTPFMSWCEEQHCHPVASEAGGAIERIEKDTPRIVRARRALGPAVVQAASQAADAGDLWKVLSLDEGLTLASLNQREELRVDAPENVLAELEMGDLVRVRAERITGVYPGALADLLGRAN